MRKRPYPIDKREWHPSLIPGPVVLIGTYNARKEPNIAPKSWLQMASFEPPILMFSGTKGNTTERNILESRCFTVNFIDSSMVPKVHQCIKWFGRERIAKAGFTLIEASKVRAPLVDECKAHLECRLHRAEEVGSGFIVFGEIVAASIWEEILYAGAERGYELLDPVFFLENGMFAKLGRIIRVGQRDGPPVQT